MQNARINVSENSRNGKINISFMIKVLLMILFMVTFVGQTYSYISIVCISLSYLKKAMPLSFMKYNDSALKKGYNYHYRF